MDASILIVDDEKNAREGLKKALAGEGREIILASDAAEALQVVSEQPLDLLLTDIRMPGMDGMELMQRARALQPDLTVILVTAYGAVETAVRAMKEGAYDYLTKPLNLDRVELVVKRALSIREIEKENIALRQQLQERYGAGNIIGQSKCMEELLAMVRRIAPTRATVLIEGESGTGKELIARAIHGLSDRRTKPFIAVHCAALPEGVLESELFGHEKGSFTGAVQRRAGRFERADKGTLFLDEVSEMEASTQVKLLRVLQEQEFERVGGTETIRVDVRFIAATNANLEEMVSRGDFREDLYYRLNVVKVRVPPLRERKDDIPLLLDSFLKEFNATNGKYVEGFSPDACRALIAYDWPGNVRELRNCIEGLVVLSRGSTIELDDLPPKVKDEWKPAGGEETSPDETLEAAERRMIGNALRKTNGNRTEAAKMLGISRRTLHRKIARYGLSAERD